MRTLYLTAAYFLLFTTGLYSQTYFTGELFQAYEWDVKYLNSIDIRLENDIILQRRLLSKKEDRLGKRVKTNGQFFDEVVIGRKSKIKIVRVKDDKIEIQFNKDQDFTLQFGANDRDNENFMVFVEEMKGKKGVIVYKGFPFRVIQGSRLFMGKVKKKKLPPRRTQNKKSEWTGSGSGILIDNNGYLITNFHVVEESDKITVSCPKRGELNLEAKIVMKDKNNDLAILKIIDSSFKSSSNETPFSISSALEDVGSNVFTLGYPLALSNMGQEAKYTEGSISSKTGYDDDVSMYQISVPVQPGNSGGPLFNENGELVGIITAKIVAKDIENVSYAIKANYATSLLQSANEEISLPSGQTNGNVKELIKVFDDYVYLIKTN